MKLKFWRLWDERYQGMEKEDIMDHLSQFETEHAQSVYLKKMYDNGLRFGILNYKTRKNIYDTFIDKQVATWRLRQEAWER